MTYIFLKFLFSVFSVTCDLSCLVNSDWALITFFAHSIPIDYTTHLPKENNVSIFLSHYGPVGGRLTCSRQLEKAYSTCQLS